MELSVISRRAFSEPNGDNGETLVLSDGSHTNVWNRKTYLKNDGSELIIEKGQKVQVQDFDSGETCFATVKVIRKNHIDVALSDSQWEMRFPSGQYIEPAK